MKAEIKLSELIFYGIVSTLSKYMVRKKVNLFKLAKFLLTIIHSISNEEFQPCAWKFDPLEGKFANGRDFIQFSYISTE